jgi:hypothetical protein
MEIVHKYSSVLIKGCDEPIMPPEVTARANVLKRLYMENCRFLPPEIARFTRLEILSMTNCPELTVIPPEIGQLRNLRKLFLACCVALTTLPDEIGQLQNLRELDLSYCNNLQRWPAALYRLPNLIDIDLWGSSIGTPSTVAYFRRLTAENKERLIQKQKADNVWRAELRTAIMAQNRLNAQAIIAPRYVPQEIWNQIYHSRPGSVTLHFIG